ncbi:MAG: translation initiation factor IF-2 N-terminal domain-containing protein, partial [Stackebrandtia sp.]
MADQEPQGTSQSNSESTSTEVAGVGEAAQLPERIRVHALAKILGTTSKRILAHLTELGAPARSAQSNLDRTMADSVRAALAPPAEQPGIADGDAATTATTDVSAPVAAAAPSTEPAAAVLPETPGIPVAGESPATGSGSGASAEPAPSDAELAAAAAELPVAGTVDSVVEPAAETPVEPVAPVEVTQTPPAEPAPRTSLFTSPFQHHVAPPEQPVFGSAGVVAAPLFLPPDAAAAEAARRKRRAEREVETTEPAPDNTEDTDTTTTDTTTPEPQVTSAVVET